MCMRGIKITSLVNLEIVIVGLESFGRHWGVIQSLGRGPLKKYLFRVLLLSRKFIGQLFPINLLWQASPHLPRQPSHSVSINHFPSHKAWSQLAVMTYRTLGPTCPWLIIYSLDFKRQVQAIEYPSDLEPIPLLGFHLYQILNSCWHQFLSLHTVCLSEKNSRAVTILKCR